VLGWVGLLLVVSCGVALPVQDAFPGWAALWPVAGALLILFAGQSPTRASASGVLSRPTLVRLGSVSYALYLWHWPLLVLWLHLADRPRAGLVDGAAVIACSILLAFASTRLVERPLRSLASAVHHHVTVVTGAVVALLLAGVALAHSATEQTQVETDGLVGAQLVESVRQGRQLDLSHGSTDRPVPGIPAAADDVPSIYEDECASTLREREVVTCDYGDPGGERPLVLTGGSHSAHWLPGLDLAAQETGWRIVTFIKDGCRVGYVAEPGVDAKELLACADWNEAAVPRIVDLDPDLVVMTSTQSGRDEPETLPPTYLRTWEELAGHDIHVLAIRDTPRATFDRVECLATEGTTGGSCDVDRSTTLADVDPTGQLGTAPDNVTFADLTRYFCDDTVCPAVIGNAVVYSDRNHITATYSRSLAGVLAELLESAGSSSR